MNTRLNIYSQMFASHENLVKIGLVGSKISLLQAVVKKIKKRKKVTAVEHKLASRPAWQANKFRFMTVLT